MAIFELRSCCFRKLVVRKELQLSVIIERKIGLTRRDGAQNNQKEEAFCRVLHVIRVIEQAVEVRRARVRWVSREGFGASSSSSKLQAIPLSIRVTGRLAAKISGKLPLRAPSTTQHSTRILMME